ncbi:CDP-glycerol glycerophosphotransferase family protein [Jatrophihabitans endophyticus]|uniref:CDP-glycerol glycerophosphotransferase family protein n=1 Tax=Jatrophihabitans endophyticus TaxID=1206085 RepID=UPI001A038361|nr:CDP-glycerol glycerophosphotransferase family protein [Jatrophihabitans endophyticus]MBE7189704.1 CDP-glycerol glycerophosphotransferase family protein [Jatrophihabitans endophyticus]
MNPVLARGKALGVEVLKRNPWMRTRYRTSRTWLRYARFRWHARGASDPTLVVFECFVGRSYAGSPRALYEAMLADPRYAGCRFVWSLRSPSHADGFAQLHDPRTSVVRYRSTEYYRAFGRARVWISNSIIAPELVPRPNQSYVQTWHGTPLKRIGIDVVETTETAMNGKAEIDDRYRVEAAKIDRFLTACDFTTECFTTAFDVAPDRARALFVETGNPRNDVLATAGPSETAAARARLGIPDGTRVLLYAPTWRDDQHSSRSGYVYRQPLDLTALREALGEGWLVLFRAHYLVTNAVDFSAHDGFVRDVSGVDEINELCLAADVLVTDYSSIYFDYALLDRPMVFFMYDLERYAGALRGFYLPIEDVPGPIVRTQDELTDALLDPDADRRDADRRAALNARMSPLDDGSACRRVLDLVRVDLGDAPAS